MKTPNFDAVRIIEPIPDIDTSIVAAHAIKLIMTAPSYMNIKEKFTQFVTELATAPYKSVETPQIK